MKNNIYEKCPIVLFDGHCNFCNHWVIFILKHDHKAKFLFASLQSEFALSILEKHFLTFRDSNSVVLLKEKQIFVLSDAVLEIAKELGGLWKILAIFKLLPQTWRNTIYRWIANNRYRFLGKNRKCMIPNKKWEQRFLHLRNEHFI